MKRTHSDSSVRHNNDTMPLSLLLAASAMAADPIPTTFGQAMHHHHLAANVTGEVATPTVPSII
jgi:hypothetical protein